MTVIVLAYGRPEVFELSLNVSYGMQSSEFGERAKYADNTVDAKGVS